MTAQSAGADLFRLINGFQASQAIHVAASLGLADLIGSGVQASADLAAVTKADPASLYRLLRALSAIGVIREHEGKRFSLGPMGEYLRSDAADTYAPVAIMIGRSSFWNAWGHLIHSVRHGDTAFDFVYGRNAWTYRAENPEESAVFDRAMAAGTKRFADVALAAYDFSRFDHVVDVGGGDGALLAKILAAHPQIKGTLFDQPHVIAKADELAMRELAGRCRMQGGDFFISVPKDGDAYLLKWILHDWNDAASIRILQACRTAMKPDGRLLLVEFVIGPPNTGPDGKFMDLMMMVMNGGCERTRAEFEALLAAAGFRITQITPTSSSLSIIECIRHE